MLALYAALRWASVAIKATMAVLGAVVALALWASNAGDALILLALVGIAVAWDSEHASDRTYAFVARQRAVRATRAPVRRRYPQTG
jgi:hypothetical protein